VRQFGGPIETLDLPEPRALRPDEVLIEVRASGVGNWDNFARTGDWDLGVRPPMALGVEAAGLVAAVGDRVDGIKTGDRVTAHSAPLREQGAWAEQFIVFAGEVAGVPPGMPFDAAAAVPVPALTAHGPGRRAVPPRARRRGAGPGPARSPRDRHRAAT
jgi:NADPH:quinone reductase-like Zn-dependent oxidoreductase